MPGKAKVTVETKAISPRPGSVVRSTIQTTTTPSTQASVAVPTAVSIEFWMEVGTMLPLSNSSR